MIEEYLIAFRKLNFFQRVVIAAITFGFGYALGVLELLR